MRKLLSLLLILGMASVATASLQISVHDPQNPTQPWDPLNPEASEITIGRSDILILDIYTEAFIFGGAAGEGDWLLFADTNLATISGGVGDPATIAAGNVLAIGDGKATFGWAPDPPDPMDGVGGAIFIFGAPIVGMPGAPYTIYDGIQFHCEGVPGDVLITLAQGTVDTGTQSVILTGIYDTVLIHQTPEPMTLGLLGLGGLGLIRRRRK